MTSGDTVLSLVVVILGQRGRTSRHIVGEGALIDPVVRSLILDVDGSARAAASLLQVLVHQVVVRLGEVYVFLQNLLLCLPLLQRAHA